MMVLGDNNASHFWNFVLDKEGKIIINDMLRPSSDDTERILNTLEGI